MKKQLNERERRIDQIRKKKACFKIQYIFHFFSTKQFWILSKTTNKFNLETSFCNLSCIDCSFICKMGWYFTYRKKKYWTSSFYLISTGFQICIMRSQERLVAREKGIGWYLKVVKLNKRYLNSACCIYKTCLVSSSMLRNVV